MSSTWARLWRYSIVGLLLINLSVVGGLYGSVDKLDSRVTVVENNQQTVERALTGTLATNGSASGNFSSAYSSEVQALGYDSVNNSVIAVPVYIIPTPGDGIYVDVSKVQYREEVQDSFTTGLAVVRDNGYEWQYDGIIVEMDPPSEWDSVGGRSAGISFAVGIAALDQGVRLNESVAMTGEINADGDINRVEKVEAKARSARAAGKDRILVPVGQGVSVEGIEVTEVATFSEAAEYALIPTS